MKLESSGRYFTRLLPLACFLLRVVRPVEQLVPFMGSVLRSESTLWVSVSGTS